MWPGVLIVGKSWDGGCPLPLSIKRLGVGVSTNVVDAREKDSHRGLVDTEC